MKMVEGKVMKNMTNNDLAKEFNCSVDTVERTLTWAKRADIFATYEDKIVQELIPLAHSAIRDALADGNAKIAVEVFKGLNLLRTGPAAAGSPARAADDDLAAYIAAKRDKAQLIENTIDMAPVPQALAQGEQYETITSEGLDDGPDTAPTGTVSLDAPAPEAPLSPSTGETLLDPTE
jgi:hypothetical protein